MATWGGRRIGSGPKKRNPNKPRSVAEPKVRPAETKLAAEPKADLSVPVIDSRAWAMMLPEIEEISRRYAVQKARSAENNPFQLPKFPDRAIPPSSVGTMAMDNALAANLSYAANDWLAGATLDGLAGEGLLFLGFNYLSELAQRAEYRVMSETIADDATRKWIDFDVVGDERKQREDRERDPAGYDERIADPDERRKRVETAGKTDRVKALQDDQLRLEVKARYYEQARNGGFFGRTHLFHDIRTQDTDEISPEELKSPIGNSRDATSIAKVPIGSFKDLRTIEPVWCYPLMYNAINPLRKDWYNPQTWFVMGQEIHGSRLPTFIPHPVPDMLKPAYAFGGLSLSQMAKPYVDIWLQTKQSVAQLIHSFSVMVLMTDLSTLLAPNSAGALIARVAMFNMLRDNQGTFVVNKNTEDFKNVSAQLGGLHELQAQAQEHVASINRIPLVKYTGIQPAGLNASSEGEIEVYDDTIGAYQARVLDPNLRRTINFEQLSLWGEIDPEITHRWEPLRPMTQEEKGKKEKSDMERDVGYVDVGALSPAEVRKIIINNKELPYTGLDPDDVPPEPEPEIPGGEGGGPQDTEKEIGANDADIFEEGDELRELIASLGRMPSSPETERAIERARTRLIRVVAATPAPSAVDPDDADEGGGAIDADGPFASDKSWSEADHPRGQPDNAGQFGPSGGSRKKKPAARQARVAATRTAASAPAPMPATPEWASNAEATPALRGFREKVQADLVARGMKTGLEDIEGFDLKAGKSVTFQMAANQRSQHVAFSPELAAAIDDPQNAIELHHNHPSDVSLSAADLECMVGYPGLAKVYAHGHGGSVFWASGARPGVRKGFNDAGAAVYGSIAVQPMDARDKNWLHFHVINTALARAGLVAEYGCAPAPAKAELLDKHRGMFNSLVEAAAKAVGEGHRS